MKRSLLFQLSSKKGQYLWDTRQLAQGIYFYSLVYEGQNLTTGKISIIK